MWKENNINLTTLDELSIKDYQADKIGCDESVNNTLSNLEELEAHVLKPYKEIKEFLNSPLEKLLIETDSPYLAPVPNRGKKNEPSFVKFTAEKLAEIKNIPISELVKSTTFNFNKLFN